MSCIVCAGNSKQMFSASGDCVQDALEKIKRHYLSFKNDYDDKLDKLQELQKRNTKLMKAVELLQREQSKQRKSAAKRFKNNSVMITESHIITDDDDDDDEINIADESVAATSKLNMALNSEQLFDSSVLMSPNKNESIANTEKVQSQRILNITSSCTASRAIENKLKVETAKENRCPKVNEISKQEVVGAIRKPDWLHKQSDSPIGSSSISRFMKPQRIDYIAPFKREKEMVSLSLNKTHKRKLKQKRLQLDVVRDSRSELDTTSCDDVVDMSPNSNAGSKNMRSWMLRNDSSGSNNKKPATNLMHTKHHLDDDYKDPLPNSKEASVKSSNKEIEFEMRLNDTDIVADGTRKNCETALDNSILSRQFDDKNSDSSSVVMVTQPSQDVIFLDDTEVNTHYETDLLQNLVECENNTQMDNLKRIESKKIKELQKQAATGLEVEQSKEKMQIKTEKKSQTLSKDEQAELAEILAKEFNDESEEFMVRPIIVKSDPEMPKKLSIKERFNINCRDCENYIAFLGDNLTDDEILTHLSKCTRHTEQNANINQTPDGFWNPLMQSFAVDDPRNEVLVDKRFVGKKRVGKYGSFI